MTGTSVVPLAATAWRVIVDDPDLLARYEFVVVARSRAAALIEAASRACAMTWFDSSYGDEKVGLHRTCAAIEDHGGAYAAVVADIWALVEGEDWAAPAAA